MMGEYFDKKLTGFAHQDKKGTRSESMRERAARNREILGNSVIQRIIYEAGEDGWTPYCALREQDRYDKPETMEAGTYFDGYRNALYTHEEILPIRLRRAQARAEGRRQAGMPKNAVDFYGARSEGLTGEMRLEIATPFGACTAKRVGAGIIIEPAFTYKQICDCLDGIEDIPVKRAVGVEILDFLGSSAKENEAIIKMRQCGNHTFELVEKLSDIDILSLKTVNKIKIFQAYNIIYGFDQAFAEDSCSGLEELAETFDFFYRTVRTIQDAARQDVPEDEDYDEMLDTAIRNAQAEAESEAQLRRDSARESQRFSLMRELMIDEDEADEMLDQYEAEQRGAESDSDSGSPAMSPGEKVGFMDEQLEHLPGLLDNLLRAEWDYAHPGLKGLRLSEEVRTAAAVLCGILAVESSPRRNPTGGKWERAAMREVLKKLDGQGTAASAFTAVFMGRTAPYIPSRTSDRSRTAQGARYPVGGTQQGRNYISGGSSFETPQSKSANLTAGEELASEASDSSDVTGP